MTKLSDFLESKQIDPRRLIATSKSVEAKRDEDRAIHLAKLRVKKGKASDAEKETAEKKGRSGRSVSRPLLDRALKGEKVPGAAKTRITRAVNAVLKSKQQDEITLRDLF